MSSSPCIFAAKQTGLNKSWNVAHGLTHTCKSRGSSEGFPHQSTGGELGFSGNVLKDGAEPIYWDPRIPGTHPCTASSRATTQQVSSTEDWEDRVRTEGEMRDMHFPIFLQDTKVPSSSTFIQHQDNITTPKPKRTSIYLPKYKELGRFNREQGKHHPVLSSEIS